MRLALNAIHESVVPEGLKTTDMGKHSRIYMENARKEIMFIERRIYPDFKLRTRLARSTISSNSLEVVTGFEKGKRIGRGPSPVTADISKPY